MFKTRNSYKRSTSLDTNKVKKKRLEEEDEDHDEEDEDLDDTDADSDYKPVAASDSDSDEVESKFFNKTSKLTNSKVKAIARMTATTSKESPKKDIFKGRNFESDSSSDEFEKVPFSLDDLGDFKKIGHGVTKADKTDSDTDKSDEERGTKESDYFDFTQIIQRQEIYKSITLNNKDNTDNTMSKSSGNDTKRLKNEINNKEYIKKKCKKFKSTTSEKNSDTLNVMDLLKLAEGDTVNSRNDDDVDDEEEDNDEFNADIKEEKKSRDIQVTIEIPGMERRKEKKKCDIDAAIKRRFNLIKKQNQVFAHKVHILCWIAHGNYLNDIINSQDLMALALSLIPAKHCYPPKRCDLNYLEKLVEWFVKKVKVIHPHGSLKFIKNLLKSLEEQFTNQAAYSIKDLALMFVCMVRALGLTARLMLNLVPVPLKPPVNELCVINVTANKTSTTTKTTTDKISSKAVGKKSNAKKETSNEKTNKRKDSSSKYFNEASSSSDKKGKNTGKSEYFKGKVEDNTTQSSNSTGTESNTASKRRQPRGKTVERTKPEPIDSPKVENKRPRRSVNNKTPLSKTGKRNKSENSVKPTNSSSDSDDEDDVFTPETKNQKASRSKTISNKNEKIDRRIFSSDEDDSKTTEKLKKKNTVDVWAEVFLEAEEKWICVDLARGKIHCTDLLYSSAAHPVTYVLGWENNHHVKDLTCRYVPHWMTVTRKLRVEPEWWDETIRPYLPPINARNREEDEDLDNKMADQSLPTSVGDFKNHPMYALKRHLLKFQAIYPSDAPTVGFIKGEPIYSRLCVVELHTRESWIKEAKLVRLGEEPYKIVKARPKYDKMTGTVIKDLPLNLYGHWQVEDYIPPPAVDGKVPRNEYGNVELYKPCMLPLGTVHLQLPALNRVAKKLSIDCAPAVVGWDFHSGGSHPILDGFIVCEEFRDILLDAWNKEIDESAKRAREKVEQRVYGNWRRIIKGLLIREKLKLRYGFEELPKKEKPTKKHSSAKCRKKYDFFLDAVKYKVY